MQSSAFEIKKKKEKEKEKPRGPEKGGVQEEDRHLSSGAAPPRASCCVYSASSIPLAFCRNTTQDKSAVHPNSPLSPRNPSAPPCVSRLDAPASPPASDHPQLSAGGAAPAGASRSPAGASAASWRCSGSACSGARRTDASPSSYPRAWLMDVARVAPRGSMTASDPRGSWKVAAAAAMVTDCFGRAWVASASRRLRCRGRRTPCASSPWIQDDHVRAIATP